MNYLLNATRAAARAVAAILLCLCLVGASGAQEMFPTVIIVGGALLALLGQGWALQRAIDAKLNDRIKQHEAGCPISERLARIETKLEYIERALNTLNGSGT